MLLCTNAALKKKAKDLIILKVQELSSFTDFFVICSGSSDRQVQAIADSIETDLKKSGVLPLGIEGGRSGKWILMDYGDVVVHVFYEATREFYDIERLWADAPSMMVSENAQEIKDLEDNM
ncbi:MAG: ribosome silencing factor [Deltaproteobacteria bacterium]|nr:ribosome silencing factor [Deltaproteobacteria bacterium]MBN2845619.1 ribosome silencing factor [Deltaproteobacteria bacterium]